MNGNQFGNRIASKNNVNNFYASMSKHINQQEQEEFTFTQNDLYQN